MTGEGTGPGEAGKGPSRASDRSRPSTEPAARITAIETTTAARLRLVTAAVSVEGARPDRFLRLAGGETRGLWARGERWIAHRGTLATLEVRDGRTDRFAAVREEAEALAPRSVAGPEEARMGGRIRFYGGFAFAHDHRPDEPWEAFPPALFHLPAMELEGDAEGTPRLRMRAPLPEGEDAGALRRALEAELAVLKADLVREEPPATEAPEVRGEDGSGVRERWEGAVREALAEIAAGRLSKTVLARTLDVIPSVPVDPVDVACRLWRQNRGTHAFLFEPRPGHALVGAAPETVATLRRGVFHATAVAGSTRAGDTPEERERLAAALLASGKDRQEQAMVVEDMVARLRPLADGIRVQQEPHVLALARIQHLETEIRARVDRHRHVLDLVAALHPTPAVCGVPRDEALAFLREEEPFERGWYAGPVGVFDVDGDGIFVPALRTALAREGSWRLFAGAGIVAGSEPASEWDEIGIKFEPVLRALATRRSP